MSRTVPTKLTTRADLRVGGAQLCDLAAEVEIVGLNAYRHMRFIRL